jgi:hypothetical protein
VSVDTQAPAVTPADVNDTTWRKTDLSQAFTASTRLRLANDADASFTLTAAGRVDHEQRHRRPDHGMQDRR